MVSIRTLHTQTNPMKGPFIAVHWQNLISNSFHIECDMIVVIVFLSILNQMEFYLCSKSKGKLSPRSYPIQCERKWKYSFLSVYWLEITLLNLAISMPVNWQKLLRVKDTHILCKIPPRNTATICPHCKWLV